MDDGADTTAKKQRGRPFKPGQSGNPAGRAAGSRHKATLAVEALLEGEAEALTRKAIEMAKGGDGPALRLCLDRIAPPRRDAPISVHIPPVSNMADAVAASSAVLAAVAGGHCTPDEGSRLMGLLTAHKAIVEMGDLERRIKALEERRVYEVGATN